MTTEQSTALSAARGRRLDRDWTWINWALALATVPAAALVAIRALHSVIGTALCSSTACPDLGSHTALFNMLYDGGPLIAGLTLVASLFTATHRRGAIVPLIGWALLAADLTALVVNF